MPTSELEWLGLLGAAVGGLGAIFATARPSPPWLIAVLLGGAGAVGGGYAMHMIFGANVPNSERAVAGIIAALCVGAYAVYARSRQLPR
jgi:hypothetical protein